MRSKRLLARAECLALLLFASFLSAPALTQGHKPNFYDLTTVRNRTWAKDTWAEVRVGGLMNLPESENKARFTTEETLPFGSVYYRQRSAFGQESRLDGYVGVDGIYGSITEGDPAKDARYSRIEFEAKQWASYHREGFYDGDDFVPTAIYERNYWKGRLSFAMQFTESIKGEAGPFFGQNRFDRNKQTPSGYKLPDGHNAYGFHFRAEDNTLQYDPRTLLPMAGYIATIWGEREWNDSSGDLGFGGRLRELPKSLWRAGAHLELYVPYTHTGAFIFQADGGWCAEDDYLYMHDAGKPIGEIWVDLRLDYRQLFGSFLSVTPGIRGQWVRLHDEFFGKSKNKFFFGFQLEARVDFSESWGISAEYSYLQNASREAFSVDEDKLGEHRVFVGVEFRP
ncbi:MAG: hypothetical protein CSA62_00775 [Planctomycetota bacterium]|nr:MAG: hypothetical protein CSA62_00775 [Planctomycetota bacterium]